MVSSLETYFFILNNWNGTISKSSFLFFIKTIDFDLHRRLIMNIYNRNYWYVLLLMFSMGCSSTISCPGKQSKKHKSYRVKKQKSVDRPVYSARSTNSSNDSSQAVETENTKDKATNADSAQSQTASTIPELKSTPHPSFEEDFIELNNETIDISKGYSFDQEISFVTNQVELEDEEQAFEALKELTEALKANTSLQLTIIGNTASDYPDPMIVYGNSAWALSQQTLLNYKPATIKDVMLARANRVKELLLKNDVPEDQLQIATGAHKQWKHERVVTFKIEKKSN